MQRVFFFFSHERNLNWEISTSKTNNPALPGLQRFAQPRNFRLFRPQFSLRYTYGRKKLSINFQTKFLNARALKERPVSRAQYFSWRKNARRTGSREDGEQEVGKKRGNEGTRSEEAWLVGRKGETVEFWDRSASRTKTKVAIEECQVWAELLPEVKVVMSGALNMKLDSRRAVRCVELRARGHRARENTS